MHGLSDTGKLDALVADTVEYFRERERVIAAKNR
jgi:hypothetical protein